MAKVNWNMRAALMGGVALAAVALSPASAQVTLFEAGDFTLEGSISASLYSINTVNQGFGIGNYNRDGTRRYGSINGLEAAVQPGLYFTYDPGEFNLYGGLSVVGTATRGNGDAFFGDPSGFDFANGFPTNSTHFHPQKLGLEEAFAGIRSGYMFSDWGFGPDVFDLSFGWQNFEIGRGFLIADGGSDGASRGAYWAGARTAFRDTAILQFEGNPMRVEAFHLRNNQQAEHGLAGRTSLWGVNAEVFEGQRVGGELDKKWEFGATFLRLYEADAGNLPRRDGMNIFSLRAHGNFFQEDLPGLFLGAEWVNQWNSNKEVDAAGQFTKKHDAQGWYAEAGYQFDAEDWWSPMLSYRYARFSGGTAADGKSRAYDGLFFGSSAGWGSFYHGEIVGEYMMFNSNQNVHMLKLTVTPTDELELSLIGYHIRYDETPNGFSKAGFNEINLTADYSPEWAPWLSFTAVAGAARALDGTRDILRAQTAAVGSNEQVNKTMYLLLLGATVSF